MFISCFLSIAATTPREFDISGDYNIHLDNPTDITTFCLFCLLSTSLNASASLPTTKITLSIWS